MTTTERIDMHAAIEQRANELASQVLPMDWAVTFTSTLSLDSKLIGIAVFATMADNQRVRDWAIQVLRIVKGDN